MSWYVFRRCDVRDPSLNTHSLQGPITEEVVFRACILAVYHMAGSSRTKMIFLTPLAFGVGMSAVSAFTPVANCPDFRQRTFTMRGIHTTAMAGRRPPLALLS